MITTRLVTAKTPQQAYTDEMDRLLRQIDRLDEAAARRVLKLLADARRVILEQLSQVPPDSFLAYYLPKLQNQVEASIQDFSRRYQHYFTQQASVAWNLGISSVDQPLQAVGLAQITVSLPGISPELPQILQGFQASLISNVGGAAISAISSELQLGVLGGRSIYEIQQRVGDILRATADANGIFPTIAARSQAIVRTEINRVFSLSVHQRQESANELVKSVFPDAPPLKKRWIHAGDSRVRPAHRRQALLAQRPAMDQDFTLVDDKGGTYKAKGPHDPRLPASLSISCRCRTVTDLDSIMSVLEAV